MELDDRVRGGLAAQLARRQHVIDGGARRVGWKLGRDIAEVEVLMGSKPVIGYLTTATMLTSPAVHRAADAVALRAETELALTIGQDVGADTGAAAARGAIAGLGVALELVDVGSHRGDVERLLAANVFHQAFAMGGATPVEATAARRASLRVNGRICGTGGLLEDYADAVGDAAAILGAMGEGLRVGDRLITGAVVHVAVAAGDRVTAGIDGLGSLQVTIAA